MLRHLSGSLLQSFSLPAHDKSVVRLAAFSEKLLVQLGSRFAGPVSILRNWTFCLFYVMAELWGSVVVSLLFWGFANQVREPSHAASLLCPDKGVMPAPNEVHYQSWGMSDSRHDACRSQLWMRPSSSTRCSAWAPMWRSSSQDAQSSTSPM